MFAIIRVWSLAGTENGTSKGTDDMNKRTDEIVDQRVKLKAKRCEDIDFLGNHQIDLYLLEVFWYWIPGLGL